METVKEINLDQLEEQYGSELRKFIQSDIEFAINGKKDWKLEVTDETKHFITFSFITRAYAQVYEMSKRRKSVEEKYIIGSTQAKKLLALMDSIKA